MADDQDINCIVRSSTNDFIQPVGRNIGTTAERPEFPINEYYYKGFKYFDTTLGVNIYWNGKTWIDSFGNLADNLFGLRYILENVSALNYIPPKAKE